MKKVDIDLTNLPVEDSETMEVTPGEKEADEAVESEFPHCHIERAEPLDIPKKGVMQVEYEMVFEGGDETEYNYKLDLKRILGVEGRSGLNMKPAGEALDELAAEKQAASETEGENVQGG